MIQRSPNGSRPAEEVAPNISSTDPTDPKNRVDGASEFADTRESFAETRESWMAKKGEAPEGLVVNAGKVLPRLSFLPPAAAPAELRAATNNFAELRPTTNPGDPRHPTLTPSAPPPGSERLSAALRRIQRRHDLGQTTSPRLSRSDLLADLTARCPKDGIKARLLSTAATLAERTGDQEQAHNLRKQALDADGDDLQALRQLRKQALASSDLAAAAELLEQELKVPAHGKDRATAATLLTEIYLLLEADQEAALNSSRRARGMSKDSSLVALLQHAAMLIGAAQPGAAAESLQRAAELLQEPGLKGALLLRCAQLQSDAEQHDAVLPTLLRAATAVPNEVTLHLEAARVARKLGRIADAAEALEKARECTRDPETEAALRRMQALLLLQDKQPGAALSLLGQADGAADLYLRCRLVRVAAGTRDRAGVLISTLEHWAKAQTGSTKAFAYCELARAHAKRGHLDAARAALAEAERLAPSSALMNLARESLLQDKPATQDLLHAAEADLDHQGLAAVARLTFFAQTQEECDLILQAPATTHRETLQQLQLDAALSRDEQQRLFASLSLWGDQLDSSARTGPLLAGLDISAHNADVASVLAALPEGAAIPTAVVAEQLHRTQEPAGRAAVYRTLAKQGHGAFAAYCYYRAARWEQQAEDVDRQAILLDLKAAVAADDSSVAAFELEYTLRGRRDPLTEAALEQALADLANGPLEKVKHLFNAASVTALPKETRTELLRRAASLWPGDPILNEALLQIAGNAPAEERVLYLLPHRDKQDPDAQRVTHLRAADEYESGGRLAEAISHYDHVLTTHPNDPFARAGLVRCLERKGERQALFERLQRLYEQESTEPLRRQLLLQLQFCLRDRTDVDALQNLALLLERSSAHVSTLRALERIYGRLGKRPLLREAAARMCRQLQDPRDRAAYLHLWLRLTPNDDNFERYDATVLDALDWAETAAPWYALTLERTARRKQQPELLARALLAQRALVENVEDKACLSLRAAEALEPISIAQAAASLLQAARQAQAHPTAAEELGRLCKTQGDHETAAEAYALAAMTAISPQRKLWLRYLAAVLHQETLGQPDKAKALLAKVVAEDAGYLDALSRLEGLLRNGQHAWELAQLLGQKLKLQNVRKRRAELSLEQHQLYLTAGDYALAERAIDQALLESPELVELLDARARLLVGRRRYREAIEVLLALSRRADEPAHLRFALLTLGQIYLHHLPDLRKAEAALTRCLQLDGADRDALEALSELYDRDGRVEQANRVLSRLCELSDDVRDVERYALRRSELLQRSERTELAARCLIEFLQQYPDRHSAIRSLTAMYRAQDDEASAQAALSDLCQRYKRAILASPSHGAAYIALRECYRLARKPRAERAVEALITILGVATRSRQEIAAASTSIPHRGPFGTLDRTRMMPANLHEPAQELLHHLSLLMEATHPLPQLPQLDPYAPLSRHLNELLGLTAHQLGLPLPELYRGDQPGLRAVYHDPPRLLVGNLDGIPEAVVKLMCIRCLVMVEARLSAVTRISRRAFNHYFHAVRICIDDHYAPPQGQEVPRDLVESIRRQLGRKQRLRLLRLLGDAMGPMAVLSPEWLQTAAFQYGVRATLLLSDQLRDAFILSLRDDGVDPGGDPLHLHVGGSPTAHALLAFVLSEDYLQLQAQATVHT